MQNSHKTDKDQLKKTVPNFRYVSDIQQMNATPAVTQISSGIPSDRNNTGTVNSK